MGPQGLQGPMGTSGSQDCRAGFTAISGGRLCISAMQLPATFYETPPQIGGAREGAIEICKNMQARVGNSADVMLSFSLSGFNYFGGYSEGWLADHGGEDTWGTWNRPFPTPDFDGAFRNVNDGTRLPFRCVY
jgi:hypothetical protein